MPRNEVDPEILAMLEEEQSFLRTNSRTSARLKLKKGDTAVVRVLPAKLGKLGSFYARIAKHWVNKKPITCPRHTGTGFGGDKDAECKICDLSAKYNASSVQEVSDAAYKFRAESQYVVFALVREFNDEPVAKSELYLAQEWSLYPSSADDLLQIYRRSLSTTSILDFDRGFDLLVSYGKRGLTISKDEQCAIFDIEDDGIYAKRIKEAMASIKFTMPEMPTAKDMAEFCAKCRDSLGDTGGNGSARSPRRPVADEDGDEIDVTPRRAAKEVEESAPRRRSAPVEDDPAPRRRHIEDSAEPAPRRRAPVDEEPEPAPRRRSAPIEDEEAPMTRRRAPVEDEEPTPAPRRRSAPIEDEEEAPATRRSSAPAVGSRKLTPPPARRDSAPTEDGTDEDDNTADEREDAAPPVDENVDDEPPPPVGRRGSGSLADKLKRGIRGAAPQEEES